MKKVFNVFLPIVKGFLYCFALLQIIAGFGYIIHNFGHVPQFRETGIYLQMAELFVADEYTGVLYPLLVTLWVKIFGAYYFVPMYLLQLAAGFYGVYYFVYTFTDRKYFAVLCALWMNTIPIVMQMHLAVLPYSFLFTCLLWMLGIVLGASVQKRVLKFKEWVILLCAFTILCQLTRGYMLIGILFFVWALLLQIYAQKHKVLLLLVTFAICAGIMVCNLAVYYGTEKEGYYGQIRNSVGGMMFQRFSGPVLHEKYMIYMPEEISECFTGLDMELYRRYPYKLQTEMGPILEGRYGTERAEEIFYAMGSLGLEVAAKENLSALTEDVLSYAFPQVAFISLRDGEVKGMTSWNYQQFTRENSVFSIYYFNVCQYLWLVGTVLAMLCLIMWYVQKRMWFIRIWLPVVFLLLGTGILQSIRGAGLYDYRQALLAASCMYTPLCLVLALKRQNGAVNEKVKK